MERNDHLTQLNKIKKVDAPPFLFTRIEQKIRNLQEDKVSRRWVINLGVSFILLLCFNVSLVNSSLSSDNSSGDLQPLLEDLNLNHTNQLYHE